MAHISGLNSSVSGTVLVLAQLWLELQRVHLAEDDGSGGLALIRTYLLYLHTDIWVLTCVGLCKYLKYNRTLS